LLDGPQHIDMMLVGWSTDPPLVGLQILSLSEMSASRHWKVMRCSALTGEGLNEGIDWLVADVASRLFLLVD
jgi:hypothetical protein